MAWQELSYGCLLNEARFCDQLLFLHELSVWQLVFCFYLTRSSEAFLIYKIRQISRRKSDFAKLTETLPKISKIIGSHMTNCN